MNQYFFFVLYDGRCGQRPVRFQADGHFFFLKSCQRIYFLRRAASFVKPALHTETHAHLANGHPLPLSNLSLVCCYKCSALLINPSPSAFSNHLRYLTKVAIFFLKRLFSGGEKLARDGQHYWKGYQMQRFVVRI